MKLKRKINKFGQTDSVATIIDYSATIQRLETVAEILLAVLERDQASM